MRRLKYFVIALLCTCLLSLVGIGSYLTYDHFHNAVESATPLDPSRPGIGETDPDNPGSGQTDPDNPGKDDEKDDPVTPGGDDDEGETKFSRTFGENSWDTISKISAVIAEKNMSSEEIATTYGWHIGDSKELHLNKSDILLEQTIHMMIIGFNHDKLSSDHTTKAGITLQMVECLAYEVVYDKGLQTSTMTPNYVYTMNEENTLEGGWGATKMRNQTLTSIITCMPTELQQVLKTVDKNYVDSNYSHNISTAADKLFLLSVSDIFSNKAIRDYLPPPYTENQQNAYIAEGSQYAYYADRIGDDKIHTEWGYYDNSVLHKSVTVYQVNTSPTYDVVHIPSWWLRSTQVTDNGFMAIDNYGCMSYDANFAPGYPMGISFACCI